LLVSANRFHLCKNLIFSYLPTLNTTLRLIERKNFSFSQLIFPKKLLTLPEFNMFSNLLPLKIYLRAYREKRDFILIIGLCQSILFLQELIY